MLINLLNRYLTKAKGQSYKISDQVSDSYLLGLMISRILMVLRGKISLISHRGLLFIGNNVVIKSKRLIKLGRGVTIDSSCYIDALSTEGISFGDNVSISKRSVIECSGSLKFLGKGIKVGNNVGLGRDCFYGCAGGIVIGDDTIIGNYVSFHSENHNANDLEIPIRLQGVNHKGIVVGSNCWIGAKVTILDGADIQDGCIIAAGAVVAAGTYELNGIYGGVPAKLIKFRR